MEIKLAPFVAHAWKVRGVNLQGHPSNRSRGTTEEILCFPSKLPLIIGRPQSNSQRL